MEVPEPSELLSPVPHDPLVSLEPAATTEVAAAASRTVHFEVDSTHFDRTLDTPEPRNHFQAPASSTNERDNVSQFGLTASVNVQRKGRPQVSIQTEPVITFQDPRTPLSATATATPTSSGSGSSNSGFFGGGGDTTPSVVFRRPQASPRVSLDDGQLTPLSKTQRLKRACSMGVELDGEDLVITPKREGRGKVRHHSISTTTPHREALAKSLSKASQRALSSQLPQLQIDDTTTLDSEVPPRRESQVSEAALDLASAERMSKRQSLQVGSASGSVRSSFMASSAPSSRSSSPAPPSSPLSSPLTYVANLLTDHGRKALRFREEPSVFEITNTQYPLPEDAKNYPSSPVRTMPPPLLYDQHKFALLIC